MLIVPVRFECLLLSDLINLDFLLECFQLDIELLVEVLQLLVLVFQVCDLDFLLLLLPLQVVDEPNILFLVCFELPVLPDQYVILLAELLDALLVLRALLLP